MIGIYFNYILFDIKKSHNLILLISFLGRLQPKLKDFYYNYFEFYFY